MKKCLECQKEFDELKLEAAGLYFTFTGTIPDYCSDECLKIASHKTSAFGRIEKLEVDIASLKVKG